MRIGLLVSAILLAGLAGGTARADLRDVATASSGGTGHVWLVFDETPAAVDAVMTATGLRLDIAGVEVRQRVIAPYDVSLISSIAVTPTGTGARIEIDDRIGWNSARAEIVDGAVLVTIGLLDTVVRVDGEPMSEEGGPPADRTDPAEPAEAAASATADTQTAPSGPVTRTAPGEDFAPRPQAPATDQNAAGQAADEASDAADRSAAPQDAAPENEAAAPVAAAGVCAEEAAAVEASPWDDDSLHAHAACLAEAGELDAAAQIYEQMLAFAPENFRALIALAELRETQGDDAAARDLYSQAAAHALSDAEAARARSRLRELQDN